MAKQTAWPVTKQGFTPKWLTRSDKFCQGTETSIKPGPMAGNGVFCCQSAYHSDHDSVYMLSLVLHEAQVEALHRLSQIQLSTIGQVRKFQIQITVTCMRVTRVLHIAHLLPFIHIWPNLYFTNLDFPEIREFPSLATFRGEVV